MKLLLCICLWASCVANAADLFVDRQPKPFNVGDPLEAEVTIGGYPIWQGEKKWKLFNIARADASIPGRGQAISEMAMGTVGLFQIEEKKFVASMLLKANLTSWWSENWVDEPCKRNDMLFKASIGGKFSNVNCVTINHIVGFPGNPTGPFAKAYALAKQEGVDLPPTVLQVQFTRYWSSGRWLSISLFINPEMIGFRREEETVWGRNSWHSSQSFNDPDKKRFIDALAAWALQFAKQMDAALEKKPDTFTYIPSWRSVLDTVPPADANQQKATSDSGHLSVVGGK